MKASNQTVTIIKLDIHHQETWRYEGRILDRNDKSLLIEAFFNRDDLPFHGIMLKRNDRFLERYYQDRWYNIFEIHDREDDHLKGWYCNITKPAEFSQGELAYVDLALDLLVYPDRHYLVLDEDEFDALAIDETIRQAAHQALNELISLVKNKNLSEALRT
ncbi:MAG: DUF402 domain-containing protein [Chloroflexota bacterium]|nr:DUF402 domain-containing protein [Chloroflexota bacterium]